VNVLNNGKYALSQGGGSDRRLTLRIGPGPDDRVRIEVADNGVGIPPENLTRIFSHGFTTKQGGRGFGLHSSALAATEMGASLTAHSDGPGKGATFRIDLPRQPAEAKR
jgi:two-component system NtrC family sensor kinase